MLKRLIKNISKQLVGIIISIFNFFSNIKILVLGDSHVSVFYFPLFKFYFPLVKFEVCKVRGATASGIENPNSKTQAYNIFWKKLKEIKKIDYLFLMLGEVDTGFLIWHKANNRSEIVETIFHKAVNNYCSFIMKARNYSKLLVISAPLPTIKDNIDFELVENLRKEIKATQLQRTNLTLRFNSDIEEFCKNNDILYLNLDSQSMGDNGLVNNFLLNEDKSNHHYSKKAYTRLLAKNLKHII